MDHPDSITLIGSKEVITAQIPHNSGQDSNFKVTHSPADSFKKSIKRDASLFTTFKDGEYWDIWHRNTLAIARAQDVAEVLDPDYYDVTDDGALLFKEKKKFISAVFDKTLQTDQRKKHIREHEGDYNAQLIYKKLSAFCAKSTNACASASITLSCITSSKIES